MNAVPDIQPKEPGTALTVVGNVGEAMRSVQTRADITALLETAQAITTITNADGRQQAHSVLMSLVKVRTGIDSRYEEVSASVRSFMDDLRSERDDLKKLSAAQEARIRGLRDEWDKRIAAEKKAKEEAEAARKAAIIRRIEEIREIPDSMMGQPSPVIAQRIESLKALAIDETFAELKGQAEGAKATALVRLDKLHAAAVAHEAAQKKLEEERAELVRKQEDERRINRIRNRIQSLRNALNIVHRYSSQQISDEIELIKSIDIDDSYEEFREEAQTSKDETLTALRDCLEARKAQEAETQRLAREKAEQEAAAAKERARIAEEERAAAARRAEEQRRHDEQLRRQREEEEAKAAERRRILEAEEAAAAARIAEQQAELDRQRQALQVSQETVIAPSDPVEAVDGEKIEPAAVPNTLIPSAPLNWRPKNEVIVDVVAKHFKVSDAVATGWLIDFPNRYRAKGEAA